MPIVDIEIVARHGEAFAPPQGEDLDHVVRQVTGAVASLTGRPAENVHLLVQPAALGRIAFGGKVMK